MNNMTPIEFKGLVKLWKALKSSIVGIDLDGTIYGTDENCINISVINSDILGYRFTGSMSQISSMEKEMFGDNIIITEDGIFEELSGISFLKVTGYKFNDFINIYTLNTTMCNVFNTINTCQEHSEYPDIIQDERFLQGLALKSADGIYTVLLDNKYVMIIFNGIFPLNKSDKMDLKIHDTLNNQFIAQYTIHKPKFDINLYIRYANKR